MQNEAFLAIFAYCEFQKVKYRCKEIFGIPEQLLLLC